MSVVVAPEYPTAHTLSTAASSSAALVATLRACTGFPPTKDVVHCHKQSGNPDCFSQT
jgi:hypothetical protein